MVSHCDSSSKETGSLKPATLGGGCFWCLEAVFAQLRGVVQVESGYAGGHVLNPNYSMVCSGNTSHAEVVQILFDPSVITFREILEVFFAVHDPTTLDRQGADIGTQYRSIILYHSPQQKQAAEELIVELNNAKFWSSPLVTEVVPFKEFFKAEDYHHKYFRQNPTQPYCQAVVGPKVAKFRKQFAKKIKE